MREIKFRAWMKNRLSGEWFMDYQHDGTPKSWYLRSFFENYDAHHETFLMQHTGLKDKNGKEIYEGDIVELLRQETPSSLFIRSLIITVKWSEQGLNYNIWSPAVGEKWEVIGTKYENPELLKGD